jgi:hypothetical protein
VSFEVTRDAATHWAEREFGRTVDELKAGIDAVLADARRRVDERNHEPVGERTTVTPDPAGALLTLLGKLPGVIGNSLSGDSERVGVARETLVGLDERLRGAGVELGDGLTGFGDRFAELRRQQRRPGA